MAVLANYGGNSYGNSDITILVVAILGVCWAVWYALRRLSRRRGAQGGMGPSTERIQELGAAASRGDVRVEGTPVVVRAGAAEPDVADELKKLADLRDRGALTDAEFEAQKARLLSGG